MGLDVSNSLFGNFHLNWSGTMWFRQWCSKHGLPEPFVGWVTGGNDGDQCALGPSGEHHALAKAWCAALERQFPDIAQLGKSLLDNPVKDLFGYFYPHLAAAASNEGQLSEEECSRRVVAAWYAILRHGIEHGDVLEYW